MKDLFIDFSLSLCLCLVGENEGIFHSFHYIFFSHKVKEKIGVQVIWNKKKSNFQLTIESNKVWLIDDFFYSFSVFACEKKWGKMLTKFDALFIWRISENFSKKMSIISFLDNECYSRNILTTFIWTELKDIFCCQNRAYTNKHKRICLEDVSMFICWNLFYLP